MRENKSETIDSQRVREESKRAKEIAKKFNLDPRPVNWTIVSRKSLNKIIANDGFPKTYPHWRKGMKYEKFRKQGRVGAAKVYELVINSNPCKAYLLDSNPIYTQKAVIAHVMGHSDFFNNNNLYDDLASHMEDRAISERERHGNIITNIMNSNEVSRKDVEKFIDKVLTVEYNIDPQKSLNEKEKENNEEKNTGNIYEDSAFSDKTIERVFDDIEKEENEEDSTLDERDLLSIIIENGMIYDEEKDKAVEMKEWQKKILKIIRKESYYLAPQRLTKYMNEGWANYWERKLMTKEGMASNEEQVQFSKYVSKILSAGDGQNPYNIGQLIWNHIEEKESRNEVIEKLLSTKGITPSNIFNKVNMNEVLSKIQTENIYFRINKENVRELLENHEEEICKDVAEDYLEDNLDYDLEGKYSYRLYNYKGHCKRHYCFNEYGRKKILFNTTTKKVKNLEIFIENNEKYESVDEALEDIDYTRGWDKMREVREISGDVNFFSHLDKELFDKFDDEEDRKISEIQRRLKVQVSGFGKPNIVVEDINYNNSRELLLKHKYKGIGIKMKTAKETLKRLFKLWGRPVYLKTITKDYKSQEETPEDVLVNYMQKSQNQKNESKSNKQEKELIISYDGEEIKEKKGKKVTTEGIDGLYEDYDIG